MLIQETSCMEWVDLPAEDRRIVAISDGEKTDLKSGASVIVPRGDELEPPERVDTFDARKALYEKRRKILAKNAEKAAVKAKLRARYFSPGNARKELTQMAMAEEIQRLLDENAKLKEIINERSQK